jgi:transcriptional regulator with XRE-family HTH domain
MAKKTMAKPPQKTVRKKKSELEQLRQKAEGLFMDTDLSQKEIAGLLGITEVTLSKWANPDGDTPWEEIRKLKSVGRPQALRKLYERLMQQVEDKENSDSVYKTLLIIKELEDKRIVLPDVINTMKDFSTFVLSVDVEMAKKLIPFQSQFIRKKVSERK